ncbi:hypothetical protein EGW08_011646 [Elysia chlorotica]|uniref:CUB domain-containing protein n=1 Tax=Elysia chlorotica TaxID=188477 RepID=A0A3S1BCV9_ELYCH|nr:hypothetical protein EGW08_011646 [Elysia chlorotica]
MATAARSWSSHFLVLCSFLIFSSGSVRGVEQFLGICGLNLDFLTNNLQSAIVSMSLPDSMSVYQDPQIDRNCDVTIRFSAGTYLMVELYYLDIIPDKDSSGSCTTGLEVLDQSQRNVYGKRLCMEAWEWEERHAMSKQEKQIVQSSPLILRLESEGPYRGNGFKVHINQFRPQYPCSNREFKCTENPYCVHDDLRCDGWNDCGDHSDEEREAGCGLLTAAEICAVVLGCLFFLGQVIITVLFCFTYRRLRRDYGLVRDHPDRSESKIPLGMDPTLYKRYNSQESMGTHYSRTTGGGRTRRDSDSSVEKLDLEKLDRFMDNGSERSYRSNAKSKARSLALGSDTASEIVRKTGQYSYNGGRRGRVASSNSINKGEAPLKINGIDNPAIGQDSPRDSTEKSGGRITPDRKSTGSRRRNRGRDDYSDYSDDDDERRRRRYRDRRSQRYSDDYDSESDYDKERHRRRRRRRSYSDDDYDSYDSEYERERRRRRSKERQRRSRELDGENGNTGEEEPRGRRSSRDRNRNRDSFNSDEEDGKSRRRRRSPSFDSRDGRRRPRSKSYDEEDDEDRDRRRRRSQSYDDDYDRDRRRKRSPSYDDDDEDKDRRRRRSKERAKNKDEERSRRPQGSERDKNDAPKDAERISRAIAKEVESKVPKYGAGSEPPQPPLPSTFRPLTPKEGTPPPPFKAKEDTYTPPPSQKRALTPPPARDPSPPPVLSTKQPSNHSYHPPAPLPKHQRLPPVSPPPSGEEIRRMEEERERRKQQLHQQRIQRHQQGPSPPSSTTGAPVSSQEDSRERGRSQDTRRERYSRDRFRQRGGRGDPEPPTSPTDYEDINPRVRLDAPMTGYREETV